MNLQALEAVVAALNASQTRYLVAGGLAVAAHGYLRFTADLDLVLQLDQENVLRAFDALAGLGYRPIVPVTAQQFADAVQRKRWVEEKRMQVLNLHSDRFPTMPIDLFVTEPFDFVLEYGAAMIAEIAPGLFVRFVSLDTLIAMKESAGRTKDLEDVVSLRTILQERGRPDEH